MKQVFIGRGALRPIMLGLWLGAAWTSVSWAESRSTTEVNGVVITAVGDASQSIEATSDGARVVVDGEEVLIGPGSVSYNGLISSGESFSEVLVEHRGTTMRIALDGRDAITMTTSAAADASDPADLEALAAQGNPGAMNNLANLLFAGDGVPADPTRAADLLRTAADAGDPVAQRNLALRLWNGEGMARDYAEGARWAGPLADAGDMDAQGIMGLALVKGLGVPADLGEGLRYFEAAIAQGQDSAEFNLGLILRNGEFAPADPARGLELIETAVEGGLIEAIHELGFMYATGQGVPADLGRAASYFSEAAAAGLPEARLNLGRVYIKTGDAALREEAMGALETAVAAGDPEAAGLLDQARAVEAAAAPAESVADAPVQPVLSEEPARFFWADGSTPTGPITLTELKALQAEGRVEPDTLVWEDGMADWVPASELDALSEP